MKRELLVVGGSAGSLEPLMTILRALPPAVDHPMAIVLHVSPRGPSLVASVLANATSRPVFEIEDKQPIEDGAVYVAPPNYHVLIERGFSFALSVDEPVSFSRPSIDVLFESAADALGAAVIGLVLSGSNDDGSRGLRRIADAGGLPLVQAVASADFTAMPLAAAALVPEARVLATAEVAPFLARRRAQRLEQL